MTIEFVDAEYIPGPGGVGKTAEPNPYTDKVKEIRLKTVETTGKPAAIAFTIEHPSRASEKEADKKEIERIERKIKRQLSAAGEDNDCTVRSVITPVKNPVNGKDSATKSKVTFWTVKKQVRTRAEKPVEVTGPDPNAPAVPVPAAS